MFDDRIRKQGGDEYVIRSAVRVHGGDDHPVGVVVMGNNGGYQHNDVDKE